MIAWLRRPYRRLLQFRHNQGLIVWATKDFEVWLVLQWLLYSLQPKQMLELGAGQSTSYLAPYAHKLGAKFLSIEESAVYARRVNRALGYLLLAGNVVLHVPVKRGWYETAMVDAALRGRELDFLFVDGPSEVFRAPRSSGMVARHVLPHLRNPRLIVVDDVHRPANDVLATELASRYGLVRYDMAYLDDGRNRLAFLVVRSGTGVVDELPVRLSRRLLLAPDPAQK